MIKAKSISKFYIYDGIKENIHSSLNLNIEESDIVSILGPNGCGKSTLLNILSGIDNNFSGNVLIKKGKTFSYVFQKDLLIPWRSVNENISIGLEVKNENILENKILIEKFLNDFHLNGYGDRYPNSLSGGEKQKIALIRNIIIDSDILFMDEPFSAIDFNNKMMLYKWFLNYAKANKKTVLLITHDIEEAITLSDKIIILGDKNKGIIDELNINISKKKLNFDPIKIRETREFSKYLSQIWNILSKFQK